MAQPSQAPEFIRALSTTSGAPALSRVRFGEFEVDFGERLLRRNGERVKIQKKPFEILKLLLERPGALVSRQRIANTLWPDLHVSYEHSLNTAVNSLRECLQDSGRPFRLIETCSGEGYRFIGPVEVPGLLPAQEPKPSNGNAPAETARRDYLTGKFFFNKISLEGMTTATAHFSSAIREDASSGLAYASLSAVYSQFAFWGTMEPKEAGKQAEVYARSAIWLNADRPEPYVAMAGVKRVSSGIGPARNACTARPWSWIATARKRGWGTPICCCIKVGPKMQSDRFGPRQTTIRFRIGRAISLHGHYSLWVTIGQRSNRSGTR